MFKHKKYWFPNIPFRLRLILTIFTLFHLSVFAQQPDPLFGAFRAKGHLQYLENVWVQPNSEKWMTMGQLYNRFDFEWYKGGFSANASMRNILNYGQMVYQYYPYLADMAKQDYGFLNLTHLWQSDSSVYSVSNFDRANLKFTHEKIEITAGRQRINWGINLVWNPMDIFNTFNYFDFDYVERPGCDAVLAQYYTGMASSVQLAWKLDSDNKSTVAGMYRFNRWNYDFQVMGGLMHDDLVMGGGWSGQIEGAGFNGEISYFYPTKNSVETEATLIISSGANYTLPNSLYFHGSFIYNSQGTTGKADWGNVFLGNVDLSAKNLTPSRLELFGEMAYQITPLIRGDLAGILNPYDGSAFVGPTFDFSLTNNIGLLLTSQLFFGESQTEYGDYGQMFYGRLKWSF